MMKTIRSVIAFLEWSGGQGGDRAGRGIKELPEVRKCSILRRGQTHGTFVKTPLPVTIRAVHFTICKLYL